MKLIKRKILKEHLISRSPDSTYGTVTASTISFNILLTQKTKDIHFSGYSGKWKEDTNYEGTKKFETLDKYTKKNRNTGTDRIPVVKIEERTKVHGLDTRR